MSGLALSMPIGVPGERNHPGLPVAEWFSECRDDCWGAENHGGGDPPARVETNGGRLSGDAERTGEGTRLVSDNRRPKAGRANRIDRVARDDHDSRSIASVGYLRRWRVEMGPQLLARSARRVPEDQQRPAFRTSPKINCVAVQVPKEPMRWRVADSQRSCARPRTRDHAERHRQTNGAAYGQLVTRPGRTLVATEQKQEHRDSSEYDVAEKGVPPQTPEAKRAEASALERCSASKTECDRDREQQQKQQASECGNPYEIREDEANGDRELGDGKQNRTPSQRLRDLEHREGVLELNAVERLRDGRERENGGEHDPPGEDEERHRPSVRLVSRISAGAGRPQCRADGGRWEKPCHGTNVEQRASGMATKGGGASIETNLGLGAELGSNVQ
jgi:hypothetical protein